MLLENLTNLIKGKTFNEALKNEAFRILSDDIDTVLLSDESNYFDSYEELMKKYDEDSEEDEIYDEANYFLDNIAKIKEIRIDKSKLIVIIDYNYEDLNYYIA